MNNQTKIPRGYAPRSQTPVASQQSKRYRSSVKSAVTNRGFARWMVYPGALDSDRFIEFMTRLVRQAGGRKVYLLLDNVRVHHSAPVKAWLVQQAEAIAVYPLPSYSPELNPDEHFHRSLKSKPAQLHQQALAQLRSGHRQPALIPSYFQSPTTVYAA